MLRGVLLLVLVFYVALGISWYGWAAVNFAYGWLHELADIGEHIATYAPKNAYKPGFELTTLAERERLFAGIVTAINQQGAGLAALTYHSPDGAKINSLLTRDEVLHLQDVANLLDILRIALVVAGIALLALIGWLYWRGKKLATFSSMLLQMLIVIAVIVAIVLYISPYEVFYQLHVWVFPPEHKWFFYYEESLMSTMMKAPDLFAWVAVELLLTTLLVFAGMMWLIQRLLAGRAHD